MERNGKTLKVLQDGHPRRAADARNAWKKMSAEQRRVFLSEIDVEQLLDEAKTLSNALVDDADLIKLGVRAEENISRMVGDLARAIDLIDKAIR